MSEETRPIYEASAEEAKHQPTFDTESLDLESETDSEEELEEMKRDMITAVIQITRFASYVIAALIGRKVAQTFIQKYIT